MVENERQARHLANVRGERVRREQRAQRATTGVSLDTLFTRMQEGAIQDLNLVLKGDVGGSVEAAVGELAKIEHPEVRVNVIHQGVGGITEGDIMLASASTRSSSASTCGERRGWALRRPRGRRGGTYRVIYELTQDIEQALVGMLSAVTTEETLGEAEVRALFKVSRLGTIAGCMVLNGVVRRNATARVVRDGTVIYETTIAQLRPLQGRRPRGSRGLRVRHPARRLQRREGRRRPRVLRDARGRATSLDEPTPRPRRPPRRSGPATALRAWRPARSASSRSSCTSPGAHSLKEKRCTSAPRRRSCRTASARRWRRSTTTTCGSAPG